MSAGILEEIVAGHLRGIPRMNVEQFERYMASGLAGENVVCELLDGYPVIRDSAATGEDPMNMGSRHTFVVDSLNGFLAGYLSGSSWSLKCQTAIKLNDSNLVLPDFSIIRGRAVDYAASYPGPEAIVLIIEVADSSVEEDRITKRAKYALNGIPTYWIVNIREQLIEVFENPDCGQAEYLNCTLHQASDTVALRVPGLPVLTLSVQSMLDGTI